MKKKIFLNLFVLLSVLVLISCKSSQTNFNYAPKKLTKDYIKKSFRSLEGYNLGDFILKLKKREVDFKEYSNIIKTKLKNSRFAYDIYILSELLLSIENNDFFVTNILNEKISIWDYKNWGEKFWNLILDKELDVKTPNFYSVKNGKKIYDFVMFYNTKLTSNELGKNPILFVNERLLNYDEGNLFQIIKPLNIKQLDYLSKREAVQLFGKRGIDGKIDIMTF